MSDHKIIKCSCGAIIAQCRCISLEKRVEIRQNGCDKCKLTAHKSKGEYE